MKTIQLTKGGLALAAQVYDTVAQELHGEFAVLNFKKG